MSIEPQHISKLLKPTDPDLTMANFIAVHGNAIIQDPTNPVNITFTSDGAVVKPILGSNTGVFFCSIPSAPNGAVLPVSVQIQTEDRRFTDVTNVNLFNGNTQVAETSGASLTISSLAI